MHTILQKLRKELKQPYFCSLFLLSVIPVFPEYISFFLILAAAFFARKDIRADGRKLRLGIIGKLLVAYCIYQTLTCIISTHPFQSFAVALMWWFFMGAYLIVVNLLTDTHRVKRFLLCLTAAAGLVGLIACIQYRINFFLDSNVGNVWLWLDNIVFEWIPFDIFHLNYALRAYSTFPNPNMLAQYLVMAAPFVTCYNFMEQHSKRMRLFSRICLFLTFAGVMFSFSRGGYIAVILLAIALVILNIRHRFAEVSLYVISTLLFLPEEVINRLFTIKKGVTTSNTIVDNLANAVKPQEGSAPLPPSITTSEIINNAGAETAVGDRWKMWLESLQRFWDRPFFGYGAGTQPTFSIFQEVGIRAPHAHNIVLQILLEGGIVALLIMSLIGFVTVKNGITLLRNGYTGSFWVGFSLVAFAVCFLTHGMVDYPLMVPRLVSFFFIVLAFAEQSISIYEVSPLSVRATLRKRLSRS